MGAGYDVRDDDQVCVCVRVTDGCVSGVRGCGCQGDGDGLG